MTAGELLDMAIARLALLETAIKSAAMTDATLRDGLVLAVADVVDDVQAARIVLAATGDVTP